MLRSFTYVVAAVMALAIGQGSTSARAEDWNQGWSDAQFSPGSAQMSKVGAARRTKQRASRDANAEERPSMRRRPMIRKARAPEADDRPAPRRRIVKAKTRPSDDEDTPRPTRRAARPSGGGGGQTGVASFYWQPQRLATGGWFNPNAMTAAHRTLPFWTRVRVTHLGNGRSVDVVINDRGPYIGGRIIDLSRAAAGAIGMQGQGIAQVRVQVLGR